LDCAALSIGTNPFFDGKEYYSEYFKPDYVMENFIQYIDLNEVFDKHGNAIHQNYEKRTHLARNLKKAELQKTAISDEQEKDDIYESFEIYERRMKELSVAPVPEKMFDSIYGNLVSKGRGKFLFALYQGKIISSASLIFNNRIMDIYTISIDTGYSEMRPNYLLVYYALKWANEKGISIVNWQSSPQKGDGVYRWKEQWGSHERTFFYLTKTFWDVSQLKNIGLNELKEAYNFHYLLPFNLLKGENNSKFTTKNEVSCFLSQVRES
jgi:lipid II:glycine glycyltransferase (peptidoglycan interpeptide bridge formation enzyme)